MIRVVIADEQIILRESLKYFFHQEPELEVIGSATNKKEVVEICRQMSPDVLLIDIKILDCSSAEGIRQIKEVNKTLKIIILTYCEDEKLIFHALEYGVEGYLFKDVEPKMITLAIKSVYHGIPIIHKNVLATLTKKVQLLNNSSLENYCVDKSLCFNQREINIMKGIIKGKSNNDIAQEIHLSKGRVANIITDILEKTNLSDRTQLAVFAVKNNLV